MYHALLAPPGEGDSWTQHWDRTWAMGMDVLNQDFAVMESIQRAYMAGFDSPAVFGRFEHAAARFHENCDRAIGVRM